MLLVFLLATACSPPGGEGGAGDPAAEDVVGGAERDATSFPDAAASRPLTPAEMSQLQARIADYVDSIDTQLRKVSGLTAAERRSLRQDVNAVQIARARMLGVRVRGNVEPAAESGRLVRLPDTTRYWVVRELDYSVPYVTPATEALLMEIGRRFHARLDSLGVPRYRLDITSVMRTPENQAALRRANRNASKIVSAHEFGTTVDIAYRKYAPPVDSTLVSLPPNARLLADSLIEEAARERGAELQAVLGRVLRGLKAEGKVMVMMERQQTVYHITVAQRMRAPKRAEAL